MKGLLEAISIPSERVINKNTENAIKNFALGPENPSLENKPYWKKMADMWRIPVDEAINRRCGNCEYYENTPEMLAEMRKMPLNKYDLYDGQAQRGYCHKLEFICHNSRSCSVWERKDYELED